MALTFGTLLSSQGAGAHRYRTSRSVSGQLAKHYSAGFAVSNPEVCRRTTRPSLLAAESAGSEGWNPSRPAIDRRSGAWDTVGGRWQRSQIHFRRSPGPRPGAIVDISPTVAMEPAGGPAVEHGPGQNRPDGHVPRVTVRPSGLAPTLRPSPPSTLDRTGRAAGGTNSRRLSGGLMLVTTAVDPPRRPTSDPPSQLTVGAGCSLRRAPDDETSDQDAVLDQAYSCKRPARSGVPVVRPRCDRPVGLPRPPTTLPAVSGGPRSGPPAARTGEHCGVSR